MKNKEKGKGNKIMENMEKETRLFSSSSIFICLFIYNIHWFYIFITTNLSHRTGYLLGFTPE